MNYAIINLDNNTMTKDRYTLKDAITEIEHASPFAIMNISTHNIVCYHTMRGFWLPYSASKLIPKTYERLSNLSHRWNYNPKTLA